MTIFLEILFTVLLVLLLVFVREKAIGYLYEVQGLGGNIGVLEKDLATQNLTSYDRAQLQSSLDNMNSILDKGLFLINFVLPISLVFISLLFYFFIWKLTSRVSLKRFIFSSILPIVFILTTSYFILSYIAYRYYFISESPLLMLVISIILLVISYYFGLFLLSCNKPAKTCFRIAMSKFNNFILPFIFVLIVNIIYFVLVFFLFFLTYVGASIIWPSILIFIIIIVINIQRIYLFNKISKY